MLALPSKTADTHAAIGFEHGNHNGIATHGLRLFGAKGEQRTVGYRLYEAVAQGIRRNTESPGVILRGDLLDDIGISCPRMDERAAQGLKELAVFCAPGSKLRHLTGAAGDDVLVALPTALRVIRGTESVLNFLNLLEDEPVIVKGAQRYDIVLIEFLERKSLVAEAVGEVVKAGRRFGGVASIEGGAIFVHDDATMAESISTVLAA